MGQPVDEWDRWPDVFVTDTAVYVNGGEGLFVLRPGTTDFADEPWTFLARVLTRGVYATSTGVLFAISRGLTRSTDGGQTWEGALDNSDAVLELPSGRLVASENACCGVGLSDDDGASWRLVDLGDVVTPAYAPHGVAYAPPSPNRAEGRLITVGRDGAAYSADEGETWAPSNLVAPFGYLGYHAVYSAHDDSLYAMINGDPGDGGGGTGLVWASADGEAWELRGRVPTGGDGSPGQIVAAPDGVLWAIIPGDIDGVVYSSADGGRTWVDRGAMDGQALVGNDVRVKSLVVGPAGRLWLGVGRGATPFMDTGAVLRTADAVTVAAEGSPPEPKEEGPGKPGGELTVYPNPSGGAVSVAATLAEAGEVRIAVYDMLGREVLVLHEGPMGAGEHRLTVGTALRAGVYAVRAQGPGFDLSETVSLVR
jgi:hypothetical protein